MIRRRLARERRVQAAISVLAALLAASCGKTGPLRPPAPRGPRPPGTVEARQIGSDVEISFTVPNPLGPEPSQQVARTEILRVDYPKGVTPTNDPAAFRIRSEVVASVDVQVAKSGSRLSIPDPTVHQLADGGVGWTLRYAVRVRDHRERPSPLVVAQDLVVVGAADPPSALTAQASADGVRLAWEGPGGKSDATFNVYRGPADGLLSERPLNLKPLSAHDYLDATAESGKVYRYVVRTVAADGPPFRESRSSSQAQVDASDRFPPAVPTGLVAVQEGKAMRLLWNPGGEKDLDGYHVFRSRAGGPWTQIGDLIRQPSFLDTDVAAGDVLKYRVSALDRATPPNESEPSEAIDARMAAEPGSAP